MSGDSFVARAFVSTVSIVTIGVAKNRRATAGDYIWLLLFPKVPIFLALIMRWGTCAECRFEELLILTCS